MSRTLANHGSSKSRGFFTSASMHPTSQGQLAELLQRKKYVQAGRVANTLARVDRRHFVAPRTLEHQIYQDRPLPIGAGQTISAPHMHGFALDTLESRLVPGARVLDVGSGSGYLTACMALMVRPGGSVLGVEKVPELVVRSRASVCAACPELAADTSCWSIKHGNALADVLTGEGPFAAIHVGAAADELHPQLLQALAPGGRMVIPVGPRYSAQVLLAVDKDENGELHHRQLMLVAYVPLLRPSEMEDGYMEEEEKEKEEERQEGASAAMPTP